VNGEAILLDTNAFIYFFEGRSRIAEHILLAETIHYSVITEIELLSASHLTEEDVATIRESSFVAKGLT
jgi:predicted nucleic acid-binding protein